MIPQEYVDFLLYAKMLVDKKVVNPDTLRTEAHKLDNCTFEKELDSEVSRGKSFHGRRPV